MTTNTEIHASARAAGLPAAAPSTASPTAGGIDKAALMEQVVAALKTCYDPEIPVDIWELGLIYRVDVADDRTVSVDMTLTSPMCPVAGELPVQVQNAVQAVEDVESCSVELVWEPPWHQGMMSEAAKIQLDMF